MHDSDERFPPPLCHPGTREAVIYRILDWYGYQQGPGKPIMWVYAPAGYGKTAVAGTVAEKLEEKSGKLKFNPVGATFFFWRTSPERNSPARFIITLAYQLSMSIPKLAPHVENAVKQNPMILTKTLEIQLRKLIIEPFKALGDTKDIRNRLIIVDGLDECINSDRESRVERKYAEDRETVQVRVLNLIRSLVSHQLPLFFLILSRPEVWIKQHLESQQFKDVVEPLDLYEVGDHMNDVEIFVRAELSRLGLGKEDLVERVVREAGGHMLYAATLIRHIEDPYGDPRLRLQNLLGDHSNSSPDLSHSTPFSSLYELYRQILRSCPEGVRSVMIEALEDIDVANNDFAPDVDMDRALSVLDRLSGRVPGAGFMALRGLHAVLNLSFTDAWKGKTMGPIRTLLPFRQDIFFIHSSFREFLTNARVSLEFHVDWKTGCRRLLLGCLNYMASIRLDSEVDEDHLRYALARWPLLWRRWSYTQPEFADLLKMFQKLLSIDFKACFVHVFTIDRTLLYDAHPSFLLCINGSHKYIFSGKDMDMYESERLAKEAISHVVASHKAAMLHLLQTSHIYANDWSSLFFNALFHYLLDLSKSGEGVDWELDIVVQGLKTLRVHRKVFDKLMKDVDKTAHVYVDDYPEEGEEMGNYEALCGLIQCVV
ncbi:hypothetical protein H1R20_g14474, partial [Candolleomyces eurysporus]